MQESNGKLGAEIIKGVLPVSFSLGLGYVIVEVADVKRSVKFLRDGMGLNLEYTDDNFGYASFRVGGPITMGLVQNPEATARHTGIGFMVDDLDAAYQALSARGVRFESPPVKQDWGGYMTIFADPDGNTYFLDQIESESAEKAEQKENDDVRVDFSVNLTAGTPKTD